MTRCAITCMEPGCINKIHYDTETDLSVYLYCPCHRSEEGRHAAVRSLLDAYLKRKRKSS